MSSYRIMIADDDSVFCELVQEVLHKEGYQVFIANNTQSAKEIVKLHSIDIVLLDMCFPSLNDGFDLLLDIKESFPEIIIMMISGSAHIPDAVNAIKRGAYDFIEKPIAPDHLRNRLRNIGSYLRSQERFNEIAKTAIGMIGDSPAMQVVYDSIIKASQYATPVLVTGETGVGKELAAQAIHKLSKTRDKALISINCASIPKELFESELFGHEQGAFTGASKNRKGYFEFADNGTIFLDEVSELPMDVQAKLLRVISEGEIQKVGGKVHRISTRIIAATNKALAHLKNDEYFRSDLFYRLNSLRIHIPPLRERKDDIILLANYFITEFCNRNSVPYKSVSPIAMQWLYEQEWKGNVRELRSTVERGVIFAKSEQITVADLQGKLYSIYSPAEDFNMTLRHTLRSFEKNYLQHCLNLHNGNVSRTAITLGIDKSNLFKKIAHYQLITKLDELPKIDD